MTHRVSTTLPTPPVSSMANAQRTMRSLESMVVGLRFGQPNQKNLQKPHLPRVRGLDLPTAELPTAGLPRAKLSTAKLSTAKLSTAELSTAGRWRQGHLARRIAVHCWPRGIQPSWTTLWGRCQCSSSPGGATDAASANRPVSKQRHSQSSRERGIAEAGVEQAASTPSSATSRSSCR